MNKLICVSGCSRGLGRALAIEFSTRGWRVAGGARDGGSLDQLRQNLSTDNHLQSLDVTIPEQVESFSEQVVEKLGCPDLLVNNAGIINSNAKLKNVTPDEFAQVLSTNLGGTHNMIRAFLPFMEKEGKGIIVNFSSYWGKSAAPEVGPYCASKWAVEGLTRSLAQELPGGLATVAFNPGVIDTQMLRSTFGDAAGSYEKPTEWAQRAVSKLEQISLEDNGQTLVG